MHLLAARQSGWKCGCWFSFAYTFADMVLLWLIVQMCYGFTCEHVSTLVSVKGCRAEGNPECSSDAVTVAALTQLLGDLVGRGLCMGESH